MNVETDQLLALKAACLGRAIAEAPVRRVTSAPLIASAIAHLAQFGSEVHRRRLVFYLLLRAEINRDSETPIEDRARAMGICQELRSNLYSYFMKIEEATQARRQLDGIQTLRVVDPGIHRTTMVEGKNGFETWVTRHDLVFEALGLQPSMLKDSERRFVDSVTLADLLRKHQVPNAP